MDDIPARGLWHQQFSATIGPAREFMKQEFANPNDMYWRDIEWILRQNNGATRLVAADIIHGRQRGWEPSVYYRRTGKCITLARLFWEGMDLYTCHTLYNVWRKLSKISGKTDHSKSTTEAAQDCSFHKTTKSAMGAWHFFKMLSGPTAVRAGSDFEASFGFPAACFRMKIHPHRREKCVCVVVSGRC